MSTVGHVEDGHDRKKSDGTHRTGRTCRKPLTFKYAKFNVASIINNPYTYDAF